mmetsp:Transcript_35027/g.98778  ORF Transcript_35027/g.98778 Transcript_35027/m.98778 type:complete len:110 (-) Transcript_35027:60-389(-)|eukprot:CAMPEP_0119118306 /NCGR_PEP_ID=MMETSP1310-20130426/208_1 /TAXON_ID=464262 /ORGANISM="Genus nov. species nov., Strain RCC2339" /LENGTH=109 /DNA_ID=CAMNT_0007107653 /DNA_START=106 /DNA_END=435 /DNA_ORIENTATION=-
MLRDWFLPVFEYFSPDPEVAHGEFVEDIKSAKVEASDLLTFRSHKRVAKVGQDASVHSAGSRRVYTEPVCSNMYDQILKEQDGTIRQTGANEFVLLDGEGKQVSIPRGR